MAVEGENQGGLGGFTKQAAGMTVGSLAALWTKENATATAFTLSTAGMGALANAGRLGGAGTSAIAHMGKAATALEPAGRAMMFGSALSGGVQIGEGIGGQDIWGNALSPEQRQQRFVSGAFGSALSVGGAAAAVGKLGALSKPALGLLTGYGTLSDGQDIGAAMTGRDAQGNPLDMWERLQRGGTGLLGALDLASPGGKYLVGSEPGVKAPGAKPHETPNMGGGKGKPDALEGMPGKIPETATPDGASRGRELLMTAPEKEQLNNTASKRGNSLTSQELDAERSVARRAERKSSNDAGYIEEIELPNGHELKKRKDGMWCRFSNDPNCGPEFNPDLSTDAQTDGKADVLKNQVQADANSIINDPNETQKRLKQKAATARASSPEVETTMTDPFQNRHASRVSGQGNHTFENFPGFQLKERADGATIMTVSNPEDFMENIERIYRESGEPLHPKMKDRIRGWIGESGREFSSMHGIPGLHAEVQAANQRLNKLTAEGVEITDKIVEQVQIAVYRVAPDSPTVKQGDSFPACRNCKNILKGFNILTGEVPD